MNIKEKKRKPLTKKKAYVSHGKVVIIDVLNE